MKKRTITSIFGIIGMLLWMATNFLRGTNLNSIESINFILGIMPNIAAAWVFIYMGELIICNSKKVFTLRSSVITSILIFLFAIISEIIHDLFLNSPFDWYDIIGTIFAIILYLSIFYLINGKNIHD